MCIIIYTIPECSSTFRNGNGFFLLHPNPPRRSPGAPAQNHKQRNQYKPKIIIAFSWQFSCHPNGCQDLTNQSIQKNPTNPKNFANPEIKLANLKIPPTKHQKKKKAKLKFCSQKHVKKKKKTKPNRLWVYNGWGVVHRGCGDFRGAWYLIVAGLVQGFSWSLEGGLALLARGLIAWVETWEWEWKLELSLSRLSATAMVRLWVRVWEWWAEEKDERRLKTVWGEVGL